jgi:hypothetical protein
MSKIIVFIFSFLISFQIAATEGMWVPNKIAELVGPEMKTMGLKIEPSALYAINQSSIKDAVVHFNGGCTSVLVSGQALLLTNHHCGYSQIQKHSTLENNYLKDGFWAMKLSEELANPGMDATIIQEIRDVTDEVLEGISVETMEAERIEQITLKTKEIVERIEEETGYAAYIKPFYYGNQFLLFITEVFEDVRLVGAPPSSIGKYGFDTDNWVWPRHTGDFSVFRIYAGPDNKPAAYSEENRPYQPKHFVPVNLQGVEKDDFTLVYGFPGTTQNYIPEAEVKNILEVINPMRIKMREASLGVIDAAMRQDELTKIQYAAKQSRISNAYKKWIGQSKGLIRHRALAKRDSIEQLFTERINEKPGWKDKYGNIIQEMAEMEAKALPFNINRNYLIEFYYMGPEILRYTERYRELVSMCQDETVSDEDIEKWVNEQKEKQGFFDNYNAQIDEDIMKAQIGYFVEDQQPLDLLKNVRKGNESLNVMVDRIYEESYFSSKEKVMELLNKYKRKHYKKILEDPAFLLSLDIYNHYFVEVRPQLAALRNRTDSLQRVWMAAQMKVLPERTYSPDANGTLRITFGKVEGYEPFDGASYAYYTTLDGVMEKEDPNNPEYVVPEKLKELYETKNYGPYAHSTGEMRVAFVASNHTSGGNSGSPVFDGNGNLIGLNFDRTWESTMSDILFSPVICRNISVDIRYVLFIMDKYAGAGHLVDEMTLVAKN